jgi:hypothetical protein
MNLVLLIDYNIDSLKILLKSTFPQVRSAHLTEAIAVALGFGSNAALRVAVAASKKPKISFAEFVESKFYNWLSSRNYLIQEQSLTNHFEKLDSPVWLASKSKTQRDNWFFYARAQNLPMIHIATRTKYADVHWDYISVDESHEQSKFTDEDLLKIVKLAKTYKGNFGFLGIQLFQGTIYKLKIEDAKVFASQVFAILYQSALIRTHEPKP